MKPGFAMQCGWQWVRQHDYRVLYTVYIALSGNVCVRMWFGEGLENAGTSKKN